MEDIEALNSAAVKMGNVHRALTLMTKLKIYYALEYDCDKEDGYWRLIITVNEKNDFIIYLLNNFVMTHSERGITKEIMKIFTEYIFDKWEKLEND